MYGEPVPVIGINKNYLNIITDATARVVIKILDVQGHFVSTFQQTLDQGVHESCFSLDGLAEGRYVLNAFCGDKFVRSISYVKSVAK